MITPSETYAKLETALEALRRVVEVGTRRETERVGDAYDLDLGYRDLEIVSEEAEIARRALDEIASPPAPDHPPLAPGPPKPYNTPSNPRPARSQQGVSP